MGPLIALAMAATPILPPGRASVWAPQIAEAERRFGIPAPWISRVIDAESGGHTALGGHAIRSRVGAIGLMQLMPATWAAMRDAEHLGPDPDDPHDNILAGTAYLRLMYDRFGYPGLFAAYNAGPARYSVALASGARLPRETLAYLATVAGVSHAAPLVRRDSRMQALFVVRHDRLNEPVSPRSTASAGGLFVARGPVVPGQ